LSNDGMFLADPRPQVLEYYSPAGHLGDAPDHRRRPAVRCRTAILLRSIDVSERGGASPRRYSGSQNGGAVRAIRKPCSKSQPSSTRSRPRDGLDAFADHLRALLAAQLSPTDQPLLSSGAGRRRATSDMSSFTKSVSTRTCHAGVAAAEVVDAIWKRARASSQR